MHGYYANTTWFDKEVLLLRPSVSLDFSADGINLPQCIAMSHSALTVFWYDTPTRHHPINSKWLKSPNHFSLIEYFDERLQKVFGKCTGTEHNETNNKYEVKWVNFIILSKFILKVTMCAHRCVSLSLQCKISWLNLKD